MMILIFASLAFILAMAIGTTPVAARRYEAATCRACRYALDGLAAGTPCPECGEPDPAMRVKHERRAWISDRVPMLLLAAALWVASVVIAQGMTPQLVRMSYEIQFDTNPVLRGLGLGKSGVTAVPVLLAGTFLPVLACIRSRSWAVAAMLGAILLAFAVHIANWTVNYWLFSRGYIDQPW